MAPRRLAPLLAALALGLPPTPTAQEPGDDAVVKFTVCSTEACGDPAKFEIVANRSSAEGRELIRLGTEQLAAMGKYDWVPHTPIICERPREGVQLRRRGRVPGPAAATSRPRSRWTSGPSGTASSCCPTPGG